MIGFLILLFLFVIGLPLLIMIIAVQVQLNGLKKRLVALEAKGLTGNGLRELKSQLPTSDYKMDTTRPLSAKGESKESPPVVKADPIPVPAPVSTAEEPASDLSSPAPAPVSTREETAPDLVHREDDGGSRVFKEGWEWFVGGRLLNRIGAFALFLGIVFFLKYAFDNNWISESVRVLMGAAMGGGLILFGNRTRHKGYAVFSQGLVGGGIAVLYGCVYAAHQFYQLVPFLPAMIMMVGVTALGMFLAWRLDSLAVALLAWTGGFSTPFLLHSETASPLGLLVYTGIFAAGMCSVFLKKEKWLPLYLLTLTGTYGMWGLAFYASDESLILALFLLLYWLLFFGLDTRAYRSSSPVLHGEWRLSFSAIHGAVVGTALVFLMERYWDHLSGAAVIGLGLVYVLVARHVKGAAVVSLYEIAALVLITWGIALQFSMAWMLILWAILATAAVQWGGSRGESHLTVGGMLLYLLATLVWFGAEMAGVWNVAGKWPLVNERGLATLILAASMAWSGYRMRIPGSLPGRDALPGFLHGAWATLLFILFTVEVFWQFTDKQPLPGMNVWYWLPFAWAVLWMVFGWLLLQLRGEKGHPVLTVIGMFSVTIALLLGGVWLLVPFQPATDFTLILNGRMLSFLLLLAGIMGYAHALRGRETPWAIGLIRLLPGIAVFLIFLCLTAETRDFFNGLYRTAAEENLRALYNVERLTLSGVWLLYSVVLMVIGIGKRLSSLRWMSIILFGVTILKIFLWDLSFLETLYRIFSFMGLGVILLGVSFAYQKYRHRLQA